MGPCLCGRKAAGRQHGMREISKPRTVYSTREAIPRRADKSAHSCRLLKREAVLTSWCLETAVLLLLMVWNNTRWTAKMGAAKIDASGIADSISGTETGRTRPKPSGQSIKPSLCVVPQPQIWAHNGHGRVMAHRSSGPELAASSLFGAGRCALHCTNTSLSAVNE